MGAAADQAAVGHSPRCMWHAEPQCPMVRSERSLTEGAWCRWQFRVTLSPWQPARYFGDGFCHSREPTRGRMRIRAPATVEDYPEGSCGPGAGGSSFITSLNVTLSRACPPGKWRVRKLTRASRNRASIRSSSSWPTKWSCPPRTKTSLVSFQHAASCGAFSSAAMEPAHNTMRWMGKAGAMAQRQAVATPWEKPSTCNGVPGGIGPGGARPVRRGRWPGRGSPPRGPRASSRWRPRGCALHRCSPGKVLPARR